MMYRRLLIVLMCFLQVAAFAGKPKAPKEPKKPKQIWYKPILKESKEVNIKTADAFSDKDVAKFKMTIENNKNYFLVFKPTETLFKAGAIESAPTDKKIKTFKPLASDSKVIDVVNTPDKNFYGYNLQYIINGLYRVETGDELKIDTFATPATTRFLEVGDFTLELLNFTFYPQGITYGTRCKFKIKYIGDEAAVIDPRRISGITREGQIVPGTTDEKPFILTKGETENINVKILSGSQANIVWNDAFKPAKIVKLDAITLDFEQDTSKK